MKRVLIEKIAKKIKKRLEETSQWYHILELSGDYNSYNWKKTLDDIFDECRIHEGDREYLGNSAIQEAKIMFKREGKEKEQHDINSEKFTEIDQHELTELALEGKITKEEFYENSEYYGESKNKKPVEKKVVPDNNLELKFK